MTLMLHELVEALGKHPKLALEIVLPEGDSVPAHFHVTEVGQVQKRFVDCGGTLRSNTSCVLQVWVANDLEHRLDTTKLAKIIELGQGLFDHQQIPVEIEYQKEILSQYPVRSLVVGTQAIQLHLQSKHTQCLAPEKCRIDLNVLSSCSGPGCC